MLRKSHFATTLFCCALGSVLAVPMAQAEAQGDHQAKAAAKPAKKWETDQALRTGMENIRQAFAASREGIEKERLTGEDYRRLAGVIDQNTAEIIKNCRLPKAADTAFHHSVLADLNWGSETLRTSTRAQAQRAAALAVMQTLHNYGEYFQHPGWEQPK